MKQNQTTKCSSKYRNHDGRTALLRFQPGPKLSPLVSLTSKATSYYNISGNSCFKVPLRHKQIMIVVHEWLPVLFDTSTALCSPSYHWLLTGNICAPPEPRQQSWKQTFVLLKMKSRRLGEARSGGWISGHLVIIENCS